MASERERAFAEFVKRRGEVIRDVPLLAAEFIFTNAWIDARAALLDEQIARNMAELENGRPHNVCAINRVPA